MKALIRKAVRRIDRNRPINKGFSWKIGSWEGNIIGRSQQREKLYIQRYGKRD